MATDGADQLGFIYVLKLLDRDLVHNCAGILWIWGIMVRITTCHYLCWASRQVSLNELLYSRHSNIKYWCLVWRNDLFPSEIRYGGQQFLVKEFPRVWSVIVCWSSEEDLPKRYCISRLFCGIWGNFWYLRMWNVQFVFLVHIYCLVNWDYLHCEYSQPSAAFANWVPLINSSRLECTDAYIRKWCSWNLEGQFLRWSYRMRVKRSHNLRQLSFVAHRMS